MREIRSLDYPDMTQIPIDKVDVDVVTVRRIARKDRRHVGKGKPQQEDESDGDLKRSVHFKTSLHSVALLPLGRSESWRSVWSMF